MLGCSLEKSVMGKRLQALAALALGGAVGFSPVQAQPQPAPQQTPARCFFINQFQDWRAPDAKTIIIRVNLHDYYRLDLAGSCALLKAPGSHLITRTRGPDTVCSAVDWDLSVSQSPPGAIPEPCIVKTMTPLTPAEIAAIPPKFKP